MTVDLAPLRPAPDVYSPEWWLTVLHKRLTDRRPALDEYQNYYEGNHPVPWLAPQAHNEFRRLLDLSRANYCGLVVDAEAERLGIEGFRLGPDEEAADTETWRIWQTNNLDTYFDQGILEALIGGCSYLLVAPNPVDDKTPVISVEHASQAVVAFEPGSNRRRSMASLKVWVDEWTGRLEATLYLADWLFKFSSTSKADTEAQRVVWTRREVAGETWPARNPFGVVPMFEVPNRPRLLTGGVSELADILVVQDRINKTLADRLVTQDFGAFPQKWATGFPEVDSEGNPQTLEIGRNRLVRTDVQETRFGQWDAAPLDPYSAAKREDVKDIASRTRTPAQYLLGEMSNVNGETLKASQFGLVSKCRQARAYMSDPVEDAMRLARRVAGQPDAGGAGMVSIWRDPEFHSDAELMDSLVKARSLDVPRSALWERWGASQTEIARWLRSDDKPSGLIVPGSPLPR